MNIIIFSSQALSPSSGISWWPRGGFLGPTRIDSCSWTFENHPMKGSMAIATPMDVLVYHSPENKSPPFGVTRWQWSPNFLWSQNPIEQLSQTLGNLQHYTGWFIRMLDIWILMSGFVIPIIPTQLGSRISHTKQPTSCQHTIPLGLSTERCPLGPPITGFTRCIQMCFQEKSPSKSIIKRVSFHKERCWSWLEVQSVVNNYM